MQLQYIYVFPVRENGGTIVSGKPVLLHSFSFADYLPCGVSAMVYNSKHNIMIIGSSPQTGRYQALDTDSCTTLDVI